jgi:hypothetical protein
MREAETPMQRCRVVPTITVREIVAMMTKELTTVIAIVILIAKIATVAANAMATVAHLLLVVIIHDLIVTQRHPREREIVLPMDTTNDQSIRTR